MGRCNVPDSVYTVNGLSAHGDHCSIRFAVSSSTQSERSKRLTPRGLALIKSCAKFYANGIEVPKSANRSSPWVPALHLHLGAHRLSRRANIGRIVAACVFSLVLPSLVLAGIVWWGITTRPAAGTNATLRAGAEPSQSARSLPVITARSLHAAEGAATLANVKPSLAEDIIVHRVKTEPVPGVWEQPDHERANASD
jgi:hypothetical protein